MVSSTSKLLLTVFVALFTLSLVLAKTIENDPESYPHNQLDMMDDDGSIETALINYLFAKQFVNRLRNQVDVRDLQRKRSYWKQCAFNAVSCFGK